MNLLKKILLEFAVLTDEESQAAQQAKKMGLVSKGFGNWADPNTGKTTHRTVDGKLVPVGQQEPEQPDVTDPDMQAMFNDPEYQKILAKIKAGGPQQFEPDSEPADDPDKPQVGKLSDIEDPYSDGPIKQQALDNGYQVGAEYVAPGNATSTFNENMSLEGIVMLEQNPKLSVRELAIAMYEQVKEKKLAHQIGDPRKVNKRGKNKGYNKDLMRVCETTARSSKVKHALLEEGRQYLDEPTKTRGFGGTKYSLQKQLELIDMLQGPIYTVKGVEIPKDEVKRLIEIGGGGENPADTTTIMTDDAGKAVIKWWSDKTSTSDPQANSSPEAELDLYIQYLKGIPDNILDSKSRQYVRGVIQALGVEIANAERGLKAAANEPAKKLASMDQTKLLKLIKSGRGVERSPVGKHLKMSLMARGKTHPNIRPYLPDKDNYSEEDLLKAFYEYMGDDDRQSEPTASQIKLMYRSATQVGMDIGENLGKVREETIRVQNIALERLNEVTIPYLGENVPIGNYLESKNVIEKFHLHLIDGKNSISGVAEYDGGLSIVMGGTTAEPSQLRDCMGIKNTDEFTLKFDISKPEEGDEYTYADDGSVTGRNVFVYAVTEEGERFEIGKKVQRSKTGKGGRMQNLYAWGTDMKNCLESKSKDQFGLDEGENEFKNLIRSLVVREFDRLK